MDPPEARSFPGFIPNLSNWGRGLFVDGPLSDGSSLLILAGNHVAHRRGAVLPSIPGMRLGVKVSVGIATHGAGGG